MVGIRRMIVDADSFRGFFDILPHAFRDPELRTRLFSLYIWWYHQNLAWLGPGGRRTRRDSEMLMGLAELIAAIPDGLSVQAGLNPDGSTSAGRWRRSSSCCATRWTSSLEIAASDACAAARRRPARPGCTAPDAPDAA